MTYKEINNLLKKAINQFNRKKIKEAENNFLKILDIDSTNPEAHYYLGITYTKEKKFGKAVIHLKNIVDMNANFLFTQQCRMILGYIYYVNEEYIRAEHEFMEVLKGNFKIVQVYSALAAIYYKLEKFGESLEYSEKAYNLDPYNTNAKNTYGFILCDREVDSHKGIELLKEVARVDPHNPAYLDSLGWAYFKTGDKKSSLSFLKRALENHKNTYNNEIQMHINIVLGKKNLGYN